MTPAASTSRVPSPCTRLCTIDDDSGWCIGCLRTIDEITAWPSMDDGARRVLCVSLDQRRAQRQLELQARAARGTS